MSFGSQPSETDSAPEKSASTQSRSGIILLGTGPSSAVPQLHHILTTVANRHNDVPPGERKCEVCAAAFADPNHPNRRDNICALAVCPSGSEDDRDGHLLLDMGKTFRSSVIRWFAKYEISHVDALLLSHGHADAVGGLDDLRDIQGGFTAQVGPCGNPIYHAVNKLPVYLTQDTMNYIRRAFSYIVEASANARPCDRRVAMVSFEVLDRKGGKLVAGSPIDLDTPRLVDLPVKVLPVFHGGEYESLGYAIGAGYDTVVYVSDVSEFPLETLKAIDSLVPFKALIIDSLFFEKPHYSHLCVQECIDFVRRWRPRHTYIVGFACRPDRAWVNEVLSNDVLPALRTGMHTPYCYENKAPDDLSFRPYAVRKLLASLPEPSETPSWNHIETLEVAKDGTFVPLDFMSCRKQARTHN